MFLGFTNFYRKFIKTFCKIVIPLALIFQITGIINLNTQTNQNLNDQDYSSDASSSNIRRSINNLSIITNFAKSKKSYLTNSKRLN